MNDWSYGAGQARLEENLYLYLEPPSSQYPTVHFRHADTANMLFLDFWSRMV